jgi:hypothetical protein
MMNAPYYSEDFIDIPRYGFFTVEAFLLFVSIIYILLQLLLNLTNKSGIMHDLLIREEFIPSE